MKKISLAALLSPFCAQRISRAAFFRQSVLCLAAIFLVGLIGTSSEAGGPPVVLSTTSVSFSSQIVNTASGAQLVKLKNRQSVPLTITSVSVTGDFAQINNCPLAPRTLASGATCTVSISFTPTAVGTRTGKLVISDDASTSPQSVSLSGAGTLTGLSAITITPGSGNHQFDGLNFRAFSRNHHGTCFFRNHQWVRYAGGYLFIGFAEHHGYPFCSLYF